MTAEGSSSPNKLWLWFSHYLESIQILFYMFQLDQESKLPTRRWLRPLLCWTHGDLIQAAGIPGTLGTDPHRATSQGHLRALKCSEARKERQVTQQRGLVRQMGNQGLEKQEGLLADKLLGMNYFYFSISPYNIFLLPDQPPHAQLSLSFWWPHLSLLSEYGDRPPVLERVLKATVIFGQCSPSSPKVCLLQGKGHCHENLREVTKPFSSHTTRLRLNKQKS